MIYACISDIHGRGSSFLSLLEKVEKFREHSSEQVKLVLLGDYCDRGEENLLVLDTIMDIKKNDPSSIILFGNHEEFIIGSFDYRKLSNDSEIKYFHTNPYSVLDCWTSSNNGGSYTLKEFRKYLDKANKGEDNKMKKYVDFLNSLPTLVQEDNIVFTHAPLHRGVVVNHGLENLMSPYKLWNVDIVEIKALENYVNYDPNKDYRFINIHGHLHKYYKLPHVQFSVNPKTLCLNVCSFPDLVVIYVDSSKPVRDMVIGWDFIKEN